MSRTVVPLTAAYAAELVDEWGDRLAWTAEVLPDWGTCGQVLLVDGRRRGHAVYAPPAFVPHAAASPTAPVSPDAVLLAEIWVDEELRGGGLGRLLVQRVARDLTQRQVTALEAFGDTRGETRGRTIPAEFLLAVGFRLTRPHSKTPRLRMDMRATVSWKDEVEQALARLVGAIRPRPAPAAERRRTLVRPAGPRAR